MSPLTKATLANQTTLNLPLVLATVWIVKNDFAVYTVSALTIGQYASTVRSRQQQNDLIEEILKSTMNPQAIIKYLVEGEMYPNVDMNEENMSPEEVQERFFKYYSNRQKSIWFLDGLEAYQKFENNLLDPVSHIHRNGFFLLVYTGQERERLTNIKNMFNRLFFLYVTNVNILMMVGKYAYLYTYFPFTPHKCHSSQPEFYISFRGIESNTNFTINKSLFSSKVINMYGCALTVVTWTYAPYIFVEQNEDTGQLISLHGIEGSVISFLSDRMNFSIQIKEPEQRESGDIYPNGTATGATKMILDREGNITIMAYIYNSARAEKLLASDSYLILTYMLAMPLGRPLTAFERLIKPFRYIVWLCFGSSIFIGVIFIYYIRFLGNAKLMHFIYGNGNIIPFTNLLVTLFGGAVQSRVPYRNFARFILTVWILYTFVLRSAYSGELFKILQDDSSKNNLKSLAEVAANNYTIYTFGAMEMSLKYAVPGGNIKQFDGNNTMEKLLERISDPTSKDKIALCLLDVTIKYYNQMHPTRRVHILKQAVAATPLVFYMPQNSYLHLRTKDLILAMLQSGLMRRYRNLNLYRTSKDTQSKGQYTSLSLDVLEGLFFVCGTLLLLCVVTLILEMVTTLSLRIKGIVDFLNI